MEFFRQFGRATKESQGFVSRHLQHIMNRLPAIANGEDVRFESLSVASLAGGIDIFEEIHLKLLDAAPFASVAPASHGIEREMARCQSTSERLTLRRKDGANFIKRF